MTDSTDATPSVAARTGLVAIRGYQKVLSPVMGGSCRYYPSCSHYAYEAIEIHGLTRGSWMGLKRIGRCHPWHEGGFDPVPGSDAALEAGSIRETDAHAHETERALDTGGDDR